jgi:hypothetical protein
VGHLVCWRKVLAFPGGWRLSKVWVNVIVRLQVAYILYILTVFEVIEIYRYKIMGTYQAAFDGLFA